MTGTHNRRNLNPLQLVDVSWVYCTDSDLSFLLPVPVGAPGLIQPEL